MYIGQKYFDLSGATPFVMGILNITPDSFSDGGRYNNVDAAVEHALAMVQDGCDIIDIGAESTRPGHTQISTDEECSRLIPVLQALKNATDIPLSVDTYRGTTAREAIANGADMINDIWGLLDEDPVAPVTTTTTATSCANGYATSWIASTAPSSAAFPRSTSSSTQASALPKASTGTSSPCSTSTPSPLSAIPCSSASRANA